jgi:hypothetical protein
MIRLFPTSFIALLLATNYVLFQIEPFEEEYTANHPLLPHGISVGSVSYNWESFDKENAPEALVAQAPIFLEVTFLLQIIDVPKSPSSSPKRQIRDKSPPTYSSGFPTF